MDNKRINEVKSITKKRGQLTIEFFDSTGKIRQKDTGLAPTKANRLKLKKLIPDFEKGLREQQAQKEAKTFGQYANLHLELSKYHSKIVMKRGHVRKFIDYFGFDTPLGKIKLTAIKKFFASLHNRDGKPLTRETKKQWRHTLKEIFQLGLEDGEIDINIVAQWDLPKQDDPPSVIRPFTPSQVKELLEKSTGMLHNYIGIDVHTGLRPEEMMGLMIQDIDLERNIIHIRRSITRNSHNTHTKTKHSLRQVPIFNDAIPFLESQIEYASKHRSMYLFCRKDGTPPKGIETVTGHAEYRDKNGRLHHNDGAWHKLRKEVKGLEKAKIHWCRHTFAVQMLKTRRFKPQEVAGMMGITLDTLYNHYAKYIDESYLEIDRSIRLFGAENLHSDLQRETLKFGNGK